jgi:hypothetical protein
MRAASHAFAGQKPARTHPECFGPKVLLANPMLLYAADGIVRYVWHGATDTGIVALSVAGVRYVPIVRYRLTPYGSERALTDAPGDAGAPARPLVERRAKQAALKDVAGMIRSFEYAVDAAQTGTTLAARARLPLTFCGGPFWRATVRPAPARPPDSSPQIAKAWMPRLAPSSWRRRSTKSRKRSTIGRSGCTSRCGGSCAS